MKIWYCKIGEAEELPEGDLPGVGHDDTMRQAVAAVYESLTGEQPGFIFSGWGAELDESQRAVVEDREPDYFKTGWLEKRLHKLREHFRLDEALPNWSPEQWVTVPMIKLREAAYYLHAEIEGAKALTERDRRMGVESLLATAAACLDAVEALEAGGEEEEQTAAG